MKGRKAAVGVALVVAAIFAVVVNSLLPQSSSQPSAAAAEQGAPAPAPPPPASPPAAAASPAALVPPPVRIRQAEPTRITIPAIGYDAAVRQMSTDANGDVNPPTLQETYRITDRGVAPGTDAANTTYFACHSYKKGAPPCNLVFQRAQPGQHVLVTTPEGTLDYLIQATRLFSKNGEFKNSAEVRAVVPGRLVLVTCLQLNGGQASKDNFVVFAQLATG